MKYAPLDKKMYIWWCLNPGITIVRLSSEFFGPTNLTTGNFDVEN